MDQRQKKQPHIYTQVPAACGIGDSFFFSFSRLLAKKLFHPLTPPSFSPSSSSSFSLFLSSLAVQLPFFPLLYSLFCPQFLTCFYWSYYLHSASNSLTVKYMCSWADGPKFFLTCAFACSWGYIKAKKEEGIEKEKRERGMSQESPCSGKLSLLCITMYSGHERKENMLILWPSKDNHHKSHCVFWSIWSCKWPRVASSVDRREKKEKEKRKKNFQTEGGQIGRLGELYLQVRTVLSNCTLGSST